MKSATLPGGEPIPVVGLGTWEFGGGMSPDRSRDQEAVLILQHALDIGYAHLDTAEMYGGGHTEELIGQALRGRDREKVIITTKVSPAHLSYRDVFTSLENSLRHLQTNYIDLYLIHWLSSRIPLQESFQALNEAVQRFWIGGKGDVS